MSSVERAPALQEHSSQCDSSPKQEFPLDEDRLLRAPEVARELGISRTTAYRWMADGTLPTYRFGGRNGKRQMIRVSLKELRAWKAVHRCASKCS